MPQPLIVIDMLTDPKEPIVAAIALFVGIMLGIGLVVMPTAPRVLQDTSAIGSLIGSFLAAMIGLSGAMWAVLHATAKAEANRRRELATLASPILVEVWLAAAGITASRKSIQMAIKGHIRHSMVSHVIGNISNQTMFDRVQHELGKLGPEYAVGLFSFYDQASGLATSLRRFLDVPEGDYPTTQDSARALELLSMQMEQTCTIGAEFLYRLSLFVSPTPWEPSCWKAAMSEGENSAEIATAWIATQFQTRSE